MPAAPRRAPFNSQNQITSISGASTPLYDANGNMLVDQTGTHYTYDAWNREVIAGGLRQAYDALGRWHPIGRHAEQE